jgi:hypothetical protein
MSQGIREVILATIERGQSKMRRDRQWTSSVDLVSGPRQWTSSVDLVSGPRQWTSSVDLVSGPRQ